MLGIDIDKDLIKEARRQWGSVVREEKEKERGEGGKEGGQEVKGNRGEKRERQTDGVVGWNEVGGAGGASSGLGAAPQGSGGMAAAAGRAVEEAAAAAAQAVGAARGAGGRPRVVFRCLNVVEADMPRDSADTVLCLSVTKWVHLNWGDAGLIALFANLFHMLRPGGFSFWSRSRGARTRRSTDSLSRSQESREHYSSIKIFPAHFRQLLLDKIGFQRVEELTAAVPTARGFDRPLFVYYK
ncbi:hypothetical protein CLOP_g5114 [Closterium sp. NIES-67]|nr:hypothetical protein CLOP_g5114 [Closterium sp. NIES-67]